MSDYAAAMDELGAHHHELEIRLMDLRGDLEDITIRIEAADARYARQHQNTTRQEHARLDARDLRDERDRIQRQIDHLTDLGVVAGITLGGDDA